MAFKIPQLPRAFTFVDESFLKPVEEEQLLGFDPLEVWRADNQLRAG